MNINVLIKKLKKGFGQKVNQRGFSLLEISMALIVIGFISLPVFRALQQKTIEDSLNETRRSLAEANIAVNQYYSAEGARYPCPSSLSLGPGDANYGISRTCDLGNIILCNNATWVNDPGNTTVPSTSGICKTTNIASTAIIIGAVPFATLKFGPASSMDYWDNKIIYAVPFLNTDADPDNNTQGISLETLDAAGARVDTSPAEIFFFSTGATAKGGFTEDGVELNFCGNTNDGYESENCDFDSTFFENTRVDVFSLEPGSTFFDDFTRAQKAFPSATWFEHEDNLILNPSRFAITTAQRVGVGTNNPQNTLHVTGGSVRIESQGVDADGNFIGGKLKVPQICAGEIDANDDVLETSCFDAARVMGIMKCQNVDAIAETRSAVVSINGINVGSHVDCISAANPDGSPVAGIVFGAGVLSEQTCTAGQIATGIDATGAITCAVPPL